MSRDRVPIELCMSYLFYSLIVVTEKKSRNFIADLSNHYSFAHALFLYTNDTIMRSMSDQVFFISRLLRKLLVK